jgi:ribonuclease Z
MFGAGGDRPATRDTQRRLVPGALGLLLACCVPVPGAAGEPEPAADRIRLTILGTGAPRPSEQRSGPSILVEAGRHRFLVDAGPGTREQMFRAGGWELITGLDTILVTHLHYDHTIEIPDLGLTGFMYGRRTPLRVYGPEGIGEMCRHFEAAFQWDKDMRRLVGVNMTGSDIVAHEIRPGVFFEEDGLTITAFEVEHMPIDVETGERLEFYGQTLGYRVDYRGRSVVFSGDSRSTPASELLRHGKGVDVLIHEVQVPSPGDSREARLANISLSVHSTPAQAGYVFEHTRPRLAVYSHIIPPETTAAQLAEATRPHYRGPLTTAEDLMVITVGDEIAVERDSRRGTHVFEQSKVVTD